MSTNIVGRENLPNVYIKQIDVNPRGMIGIRVSSVIHLYDIPSGGWYGEEDLKNNMKILVVLSSSEDFDKEITLGRASLTPDNLKFINGYNKQQVKHKTFSISGLNRKSFENPLANGHVVFPYKCSFNTTDVNSLSIFAVCYLDTRQFSSQNNLELSTRNVSLYHGAITGERVLVKGQTILESNMFANNKGKQHIGPVYGSNGTFFAGSNISPSKQNQLNLVSTRNTKIKDYRMPFRPKSINKTNKEKKPVFSQLYSSVDSAGTVRATFDLNMENLYMQTSGYARLLHALDKDIYDAAVDHLTISDLSVYAQRVVEKVRTSQSGTKKIKPVPIGYRKKVISSKESKRGLDTVIEETAKIQELDIHLGKNEAIQSVNRKRRTVCFSHTNTRYTRGSIGYSVELSYKDPSEQIVLDIVRQSSIGLSALKNYRQRARRLTNYNYHAKQTKPNLYNGTGAGIWKDAVQQFMEMYTLMFDTSNVDLERLVGNLVVMVHPKSLTMKSLNWFCEKYGYMLNRLKKYFKDLIPSFTPDVKLGYVQSDMQKGKLTLKNNFENTVDLSDYRTSVSFVPKSLTGDTPPTDSFPILSYGNYRGMARAERLRFFSDNPAFTPSMVSFLNQDLLDQLNNIDYNSYTYFSPSCITHGVKNKVDIASLETIDLDQFNYIYNRTQRRKYRIGYSPSSKRQDNINAGRKSSFYIKQSKRESEEVEEYKSSDENLGAESAFVESQNDETKIDTANLDEKTKNKFKSYDRAKSANFSISFEEFNMQNQKNVLTELASKNVPPSIMKQVVRGIPLHIKALLGSEYGFAKNNIFYGHEDLLQDTQVRDLIKTCFFSLIKIQYLEDYASNNFKNPKWRDMTSYSFNSLIARKNKTVLCRIVPYTNATLRLEADMFDRFGIENKYFFISKEPELDRLRVKGRRIRNGGQVIIERQGAERRISKLMNSFVKNSTLSTNNSVLGCNTLVVNQPSSKNGPLQQVDYREVNDLVGNRTSRPASTNMGGAGPTNTGGSY